MAEIGFDIIAALGSIATALATIVLVVLLWLTFKHLEAASKLSRIQTEHRFRPWIGPVNSIKYLSTTDKGQYQFDISIKNFGEIPSTNVVAMYSIKNELITKDELNNLKLDNTFNLGPLLPNMEKHYWFFIDSELINKAKNDNVPIYISLRFEYEAVGKKSGYGMISQYEPSTNSFIHKDMWVGSLNSESV